MNHLLGLAAIMTMGWTSQASAGGWIGGGGELLEDSMNPWFVQAGQLEAATIVRYCIEADEQNFGVPLASLERHVQMAIDYWVDEFGSAANPVNGPGNQNRVLVAKEVFVPVRACDDSALIRFQFGVLNVEQLAEFKAKDLDPKRFVALAARTEYDEMTLRSKGFIYVAPPRGPLAMSTPDMADEPWQSDDEIRLFSVLRHELGHVFGLQHTGTHRDLMGGGFPEYAVSRTDRFTAPSGVFKLPAGAVLRKTCYGGQGIPEFLVRFFSIPLTDVCIGLKFHPDRLEVVSSRGYDHVMKVAGTAALDTREMIVRTEPLVRVWLPEAQAVFQNVPASLGRLLSGPMVMRRQATATYVSKDGGPSRELQLLISPEELRIGGISGSKIILDVFSHVEDRNL